MFTQDVQLPGMLTAVVLHPPRFGARVKSMDAAAVRAFPGVRHVIEVPNGVAVVAASFWTAKKARDALKVEWNDSRAWTGSTDDILAEYRKLAEKPGQGRARRRRRREGDRGARRRRSRRRSRSRTSRTRRWSR
jgi:isoquinoline 1-oxidoreductase beta subunit